MHNSRNGVLDHVVLYIIILGRHVLLPDFSMIATSCFDICWRRSKKRKRSYRLVIRYHYVIVYTK